MIIILLPDIWYYWTSKLLNPCTPELLYPLYSCPPTLLLLLIAQSKWRPTEHAWRRDDENVFHDRASVRRILNGTKCHTEQSVTPHTWWGPPLESMGATSRIHSPHRAKCHTEQSATPHTWWGATSWICGGHLLNLNGYFLPPACTA